MLYLVLKFSLSALLIVAVSEVAKQSGWWGGLLASLPLVSVLSFVWLYRETHNTQLLASLSYDIFWFVLPSLLLFIVFPLLLKRGVPFYGALGWACLVTMLAYAGCWYWLQHSGIRS